MSDLLEQVGFKKRVHVGISLSVDNFIEIMCIDEKTKSVTRYASGNIKYNSAIREIIDFDEFAEVVEGLFDEIGLSPQECSVTINLPNVHFGLSTTDNLTDEAYIIENLQTEIEDLYIFKRNEPIIAFSQVRKAQRGSQDIVYSAIQAKTVEKIIEIFDSLQVDIARIDTSYSSLLKAIQFNDKYSKYMNETASILLITSNSCCYFYMNGNQLVDFMEEPLAVKSFTPEEVYATISRVAENTISKNNPSSLLIISETTDVNAELLSQRLQYNGEICVIEKLSNNNETIIDISDMDGEVDSAMVSYITLEAIGAAASSFDDYPLNINFLPSDKVDNNLVNVGPYEVNITRFVATFVIMALVLGSAIGLLGKTILDTKKDSISEQTKIMSQEISVFDKKMKNSNSSQAKNIFPIMKKIVEYNKDVVEVYNGLSTEMPDGLYIKKFVTNSDGGIGIIGEAKSAETVSSFVNGLKEKNDNLMLAKLAVNSQHDLIPGKIPNGYTFEIKTQGIPVDLYSDETTNAIGETVNKITQTGRSATRGRRGSSSSSLTPPPPMI